MEEHDPVKAHRPDDWTDEPIGQLVRRAYRKRVDVETAARHLYAIHRAAGTLASPARTVGRSMAVLLCTLALFATSGIAVASSGGALPGDSLYPVKRGVEQVRLLVSVGSEADAQVHLAIARRRLADARTAATRRPEVVPELIRDAVQATQAAGRVGGSDVAEQVALVHSETEVAVAEVVAGMDEALAAETAALLAPANHPDGQEVALAQDGEEEATEGSVAADLLAELPIAPPEARARTRTPVPDRLVAAAGDRTEAEAQESGQDLSDEPEPVRQGHEPPDAGPADRAIVASSGPKALPTLDELRRMVPAPPHRVVRHGSTDEPPPA